ncbi:MAG TPA: DUF134 domain-containing protein [Candidatus Nanopusillus sp.]|nr:DUF134 domain-containing protein [Candidatus Nanopusillus sp.]
MKRRYRWRWKALQFLGEFDYQLIPVPVKDNNPTVIYPEEFLAWKLHELENKTMEEIAEILGASRVSISNLIKAAREKILRSILEGRPILIKGK